MDYPVYAGQSYDQPDRNGEKIPKRNSYVQKVYLNDDGGLCHRIRFRLVLQR